MLNSSGKYFFLFPAATVPPSRNTFKEIALSLKCAFRKKTDWLVPFQDQTSKTVDVAAGSFKIEEALADPLIKNVCVNVQKKGLKALTFFSNSFVRKNQL